MFVLTSDFKFAYKYLISNQQNAKGKNQEQGI